METLFKDIRYGIRSLLKNPVFSTIAVITLALGIGANTAIFSVINAVVLRPLPYQQPDRLVMLWGTNKKEGTQEQLASFADFNDFRSQAKSFSGLAATSPLWNFVLTGDGEPQQLQGLYASANLFSLLGVAPIRGRDFVPDDDRVGAPQVAIITHSLWQRRFAGDQQAVGQTLMISGNRVEIVGIMPEGFQFLEPTADIWMPLSQNQFVNSVRNVRLLSVVGRLNSNTTLEQANAEVSNIAAQLAMQYPDSNTSVGLRLVPLQEYTSGKVRPALRLLFGAVALVLLIACANVVNLMLVRGAARQKEIAVRAALGARRLRLLRQLLTESITLSLLGGAGGILLAAWGIKLLLAFNPFQLPQYNKIGIDGWVLAFTLLTSLLTGIVFGLAPALQALKLDLHTALKEGGRGRIADSVQRRISNALVITEVAMAMVLLIAAGLLLRSFVRLLEVKPGFVTENVLTLQVGLPNAGYSQPAKRVAFYQQLETSLRALPQVMAVGFVTRLPLMTTLNNVTTYLSIEGRPVPMGERSEVDFRRASTGYYQAMGIPLLAGRLVTEQDVANNNGAVVVNEALTQRFFPNEDPIGKKISTATNNGQGMPWQTIVGVVGNVRHLALDVEPRPEVYYHTNTNPPFGPVVVIRSSSDPKSLITTVRARVREIDKDLPLSNISTMEQLVAQSVAQRRFGMFLLALFALLALVLAAIGIYGVVSYSVSQRTQEIGVRMALGARGADVMKLVVQGGMSVALIGVGIGLLGAVALTRVMSRLLFGVAPTDALTFATVSIVLTAVALLACYIPARRATKVDPLVALRYE